MQLSKSVIITCAGVGSRLGSPYPKCMLDIHGKPLIVRHLEMLSNVKNIYIVVGFEASKVIETVLNIRKDVVFVFNHDFLHTGNVHSLFLASQYCKDKIISLDGDLVIDPKDFQKFLDSGDNLIGYTYPRSRDLISCEIAPNSGHVISFNKSGGEYEWSGLFQLEASKIKLTHYFIYELLQNYLPSKGILINAMDIDSSQDYELALKISREFYASN